MRKFKSSLLSACVFLASTVACSAWADNAVQPVGATQGATPSAQTASSTTPSPYQLNLLYTGEMWGNATGGIHTGTMYMNNADAQLRVDTDKAFGWTGGRLFLEGFYAGQNSLGNQYVGAVDQQSPIDTAGYTMFRLYQAYYDQTLGNTDLLFGIYDLETEFSNTKPMSLFLSKNLTWNTAFDMSGTMPENGTVGPGNYPYTPLAFRVNQTINNQWNVRVAIADAASDDPSNPGTNDVQLRPPYGLTAIGEVDYTPSKHTKVMAGLWGMNSKLPTIVDQTKHVYGDEGGYVGGATRLYTQEGLRGLDGFLTLGIASPTTTTTDQSLNGGLVYTGLFDARPRDKMGISFNENHASDPYKKSNPFGNGIERYETSFEATYRAPVNSWATVQPDIQYIVNPGYNPNLKNDLVVGVHFEIGHLFDL